MSTLVNAMGNFENMSSTMLNSEHDYGTINIDGEEEKISTTNYRRLMRNPNREIRKEVRDKYCKTLDRYGATSAQKEGEENHHKALSDAGGINTAVAWMCLVCYVILYVASIFIK